MASQRRLCRSRFMEITVLGCTVISLCGRAKSHSSRAMDTPASPKWPVTTQPGSLDDSLKALEADHDFLLKGDVFSPQLIERWIGYKRDREITPLRMRPHPLEFSLYYDI